MPLELEGGCLVASMREGETERLGELRMWNHFQGEHIAMRVIEGRGVLRADAEEVLYDVNRDEGIHLFAGLELELDGTYVAVQRIGPGPELRASNPALGARRFSLQDRPMQQTGDRFYRELIQSDITQFVGSIPPGRAPDHYHYYEEMLCVLDGYGTMWAGKSSAPIEKGSCIYLPVKQVHCVENRSPAYLRLLGVFYPAGSPAVRYGEDNRA